MNTSSVDIQTTIDRRLKGKCCSQARATPLNRAKIVNRSIGASAAQLLKDQIGLQTQQQGLAWIGLTCRSTLLQKLSLVERLLAGLLIKPLQTAMSAAQNH